MHGAWQVVESQGKVTTCGAAVVGWDAAVEEGVAVVVALALLAMDGLPWTLVTWICAWRTVPKCQTACYENVTDNTHLHRDGVRDNCLTDMAWGGHSV